LYIHIQGATNVTATISRWGNSLGIRIPRAALDEAHLEEGDQVSVTSVDGKVVIAKANKRSLDELIAKITPQNRHAETFESSVGNEAW
jgi:antitoxin MazE